MRTPRSKNTGLLARQTHLLLLFLAIGAAAAPILMPQLLFDGVKPVFMLGLVAVQALVTLSLVHFFVRVGRILKAQRNRLYTRPATSSWWFAVPFFGHFVAWPLLRGLLIDTSALSGDRPSDGRMTLAMLLVSRAFLAAGTTVMWAGLVLEGPPPHAIFAAVVVPLSIFTAIAGTVFTRRLENRLATEEVHSSAAASFGPLLSHTARL